MKKSVCLMAILGAMGMTAAHADTQSVIVDFTGEVRDKTCDVELTTGDLSVELGEIGTKAAKGEVGKKIPVIFKLSNCKGNTGTTRTITLENDLMTQNPAQWGNLKNGQLSTDHDKVVVQFFQSGEDLAPEGLKPDQTETDLGGTYFIEVGHAALKAFDKEPAAGPVNAKAMFTVTYQ